MRDPRKVKSNGTLACMARLLLRRYRAIGDPQDLTDHETVRAEMERRGMSDRFGVFGWDDGCSSLEIR